MRKLFTLLFIGCVQQLTAQNVGIGTTTPQATLDVRGNTRTGGLSKFISFDSVSGKIVWNNAALFVPVPQYLMQHSASAEGLYYGNSKLLYRGLTDTAFYTDWSNGNGYFRGNTGIGTTSPGAKLHVVSGAPGYSGGHFPGIVLEGDGNTYLNIITPNNSESSVLFGKASDAASGGIVYNNVSLPNGLQFRTNGNVNRMIIGSTGNVGIGTTAAPAEKLEVTGNVKADKFIYNTPKTFSYNLSGVDFKGEKSRDTTVLSLGSGGIFMGHVSSTTGVLAAVHLPQGAVMQNLTIYLSDFSGAQNLQAVFYRKTIVSNFFPDNIGTVTSSGSAGLAAYTTPVNFLSNVVDNNIYTYYLHVYITPFPSVWSSSSLEVRAAVIEYTLNEAQ